MQVHAVGDHLAGDLGPVQQGTGGARLAVMQGPHGVEQVGGVSRARVDGRHGDIGGGVGVTDGDGHTGSPRRLDHRARAGQLGSEGEDPQLAAGRRVQPLEDGGIGSQHVPRILGAGPGWGQERAFQVQAGDDTLDGQSGQQVGPGGQLRQWRGDQAGQHGRGAVVGVKGRGLPGLISGSLGERRSAAAVDVQVDEPREHPLPAQVDSWLVRGRAGPDRVDQVPGQPDPAGAAGRHLA